jgi:hypothetical protein
VLIKTDIIFLVQKTVNPSTVFCAKKMIVTKIQNFRSIISLLENSKNLDVYRHCFIGIKGCFCTIAYTYQRVR